MNNAAESTSPSPDPAEDNAFFPSPFSLSRFTSSKSNLSGADYPNPYSGGRWKVLVVCTDERYLAMENGTLFSTGNHPVETLLPMYHLDKAGFEIEVATLSGNPVKFEHWAMPKEDSEVMNFYSRYRGKFQRPLRLSEVVTQKLGANSDYLAVFIPGGHGALIGLPQSSVVKELLEWAMANEKYLISLCHGPAAFLAVGASPLFQGSQIVAFPDAVDGQTPGIGYMPGHLTFKFGEQLRAAGFDIRNSGVKGEVLQDRNLLTGDSPLASNALGILAAQTLLAAV